MSERESESVCVCVNAGVGRQGGEREEGGVCVHALK